MKKYIVIIIIGVLFFSCKKSSKINRAQLENDVIKKYIEQNHLNATETGSGLFYVIDHQGTGAFPSSTSNVTVVYKGYLLNGTVFDQSSALGINLNLSSVIDGWKEGIPYFKLGGGKGKLIIPSALGYGSQAQSSIPANSILVFDIELP
jgi:FKBP-type peptidyl-prolyl cis-trans isomerase FkpA